MKMNKMTVLIVGLLLCLPVHTAMADGGGDLKIGYVYIDEDGNRSVSYPSFNYHEGPAFSLEKFGYRFGNGIKLSMDLRNVNLENRNVSLGLSKTGLCGIDFSTNRYVRVHDFDGDAETRRDRSMVRAWLTPSKYIKFFGGGSFNTVSGSRSIMFGGLPGPEAQPLDYMSSRYTFGGDFKYEGRLLHAEYGIWDYTDDVDEDNDQSRETLGLRVLLPLPQYERIVLSGAFRSFETEFESSGRRIESWTVMGGALYKFLDNARLNYIAKLNRAGSSDDFVDTDNLSHMVYLSYSRPQVLGITAGYQYHISDDFEDAVISNSYYFGGWLVPSDKMTFRFEQGFRAEEVDEGARLVGDEERSKTKVYGTYKGSEQFTLKAGFELKSRENDQLGTSADYDKIYVEPRVVHSELFTLSGGYSLSRGEYENTVNSFEFRSHQVFGNIDITSFEKLTGGFGIDYFRNEKDLDSEAVNLLFKVLYSHNGGLKGELIYRVYNFDDLLFVDKYYTGNIVEFNLIKSFSIR
jgi:hypothetical protein